MQGEGPKRLQLSATGPTTVKAGDIAVSGDIEVMNKDLVICHLDEGATLNMELTADIGKGYVAAVANRPADAPIGLIPTRPTTPSRKPRVFFFPSDVILPLAGEDEIYACCTTLTCDEEGLARRSRTMTSDGSV